MKKLKTLITIVLFTFIFSGCLQIATKINVKKDGSGTINEKVLMSKTFINMMKDFAQAFQDSATTEEFAIFKDDEIIADAKDYGDEVIYVSHKFVKDDNWEGYEAVYSFDDITKIKIEPDPDSKVGMSDEGEGSAESTEYYFFKFKKGDVSELIIDRPPVELNEELDESSDEKSQDTSEQSDEEMGEEFLKMMEGMKIDITVQVDGKISETNASYVNGSTVTLFQMDLSEMMKNKEAFKEFKNREPKNIEEMKEFLEKFPGMKIEVEKPVSVEFK